MYFWQHYYNYYGTLLCKAAFICDVLEHVSIQDLVDLYLGDWHCFP